MRDQIDRLANIAAELLGTTPDLATYSALDSYIRANNGAHLLRPKAPKSEGSQSLGNGTYQFRITRLEATPDGCALGVTDGLGHDYTFTIPIAKAGHVLTNMNPPATSGRESEAIGRMIPILFAGGVPRRIPIPDEKTHGILHLIQS